MTICKVKLPCRKCPAAKWNKKKTKVIGCNFNHVKRKIDILRWLVAVDMSTICLFLVANFFVNKPIINIIVLIQFLLLLEMQKHRKGKKL
jgi:uncharacterized paraquat-inducible protein A